MAVGSDARTPCGGRASGPARAAAGVWSGAASRRKASGPAPWRPPWTGSSWTIGCLGARQHPLAGTRYRLDYAWPPARLAVEVDGYASHAGLEAFGYDRERQNALVLAGWTVLRFTWAHVRDRPGGSPLRSTRRSHR